MRVLNAGCGKSKIHEIFHGWHETRVDVDPSVKPDVVASLDNLGDIGEFDAVYCCHVLEHFTALGAQKVMAEFYRVLKHGGFAMIIVPNLDGIRPTMDVVYESSAGPITGLDMIYGKSELVAESPYMAHKTGFVADTLRDYFDGYSRIKIAELSGYNLLGVGVKEQIC